MIALVVVLNCSILLQVALELPFVLFQKFFCFQARVYALRLPVRCFDFEEVHVLQARAIVFTFNLLAKCRIKNHFLDWQSPSIFLSNCNTFPFSVRIHFTLGGMKNLRFNAAKVLILRSHLLSTTVGVRRVRQV